jgi:filamentous hemagglutinin family protein
MKLKTYLSILSLVLTLPLTPREVLGQVRPDASVSTRVQKRDNQIEVIGGTTAGTNLFHSFTEFSIPTGDTVYFNNSPIVNNIINRVTGKNLSNIDGTIKANGIANIFLINPNGIIFGQNARLNIGGSFLASTANNIKFADGSEFSATATHTPLLSLSVPIGLQFGANPQAIINQANDQNRRLPNFTPLGLQVPFGQTIALIGGDVHLPGGNLTAYGGRVAIGSVGDNSFVSLTQDAQGWRLGYKGTNSYQDLQLLAEASLNASGANGIIALQAQDIILTDGSQIILSTVGLDNAGNLTDGSIPSGNLTINAAQSLFLINNPQNDFATGIFVQVYPDTTGRGGNIVINTSRLSLQDGAIISAGTTGQGMGGNLTINASESVEILGVGLSQQSILTTASGLSAVIDPEGIVEDRFSQGQLGDAGNMTINTRRLTLADGGQIQAVTGGGTFYLQNSQGQMVMIEVFGGRGGNITINASESILITGTGQVSDFITNALVDTASRISSSTGLPEFDISGSQNAGNIQINTSQLTVSNRGQIIVDSFSLDSLVEAGNLSINASSILLDNQAQLFANSVSGGGGNINLRAANSLTIRQNSLISASADNNGDGGNINITTPFIFAVPLENSDISANAEQGRGGNVTITADGIFGLEFRPQLTQLSDITVSSQFAQSGTFALNGLEVNPQNDLINAPTQVIDTENLIARTCGRGGALNRGEFTITGRGGLPTDPSQTLELGEGLPDFGERSRNSVVNTISIANSVLNPIPEPIVEAQGWIVTSNGQIILTDRVPDTTPHQTSFTTVNCYLGDQRS